MREFKGSSFRSNKDTNGGRIPEETGRVHLAPNETSCNHLRQCRSLQDHSRLDQSYHEEREVAELLSERGNSLADSPCKIPWWGGFYEILIKEIKKTLHKTLGRSRLSYEAMESVVMDVERNLNNHSLTWVEAKGEEEVLTPNMIMWERDAHPIEDIELIEDDKEKLTKMNKRLEEAKAHAWRR